MNPKRIIVTVLLMVSILLTGCDPSAAPVNAPAPGSSVQNIADLVELGTITFRLTSGAINELGLEIQNTTDQALQINIPAGTFFVNMDPKFQNMVIRHAATAFLQPYGQADLQLEAACANLHLTEPTQENTFTIQRTSDSPELIKIIDKLNSTKVDYPVEQAAIWIVTDDATFDELGMLVEGSRFGTSIINENDAAWAMMLVDEAGLSIRAHAIWADLDQFIGKATGPDLSAWVDNQVATQSVEQATQAVEAATLQAHETEIAREETQMYLEETQTAVAEDGQYASTATASSEYTHSTWSAMQATGAPDTTDCGDKSSAWASRRSTSKDWLLLTYELAVIPTRIVIYETYHPGAVSQVEVLDENDNPITVYEAAPKIINQCPHKLEINIKSVTVPVRSVRVTIDQSRHNGWAEIDAVQLFGSLK